MIVSFVTLPAETWIRAADAIVGDDDLVATILDAVENLAADAPVTIGLSPESVDLLRAAYLKWQWEGNQ